jgi:prefoldin subunit 5
MSDSLCDTETALDAEIHRLQEELLKLAMDKKNLEIAIQTLHEREMIDQEYLNSR